MLVPSQYTITPRVINDDDALSSLGVLVARRSCCCIVNAASPEIVMIGDSVTPISVARSVHNMDLVTIGSLPFRFVRTVRH